MMRLIMPPVTGWLVLRSIVRTRGFVTATVVRQNLPAPLALFGGRGAPRCGRSTVVRRRASAPATQKVGVNESMPDDKGNGSPRSLGTGRQMWLDLRGTAVFPAEALHFLEETLDCPDIPRWVDRILLSQDTFDRVLEKRNSDRDLLYVVEETDELVLSSHDTQQSFPVGRILEWRPDDRTLDPMVALDATSRGGWVVIDAEEEQEGAALREQASSLIQFLSSAPSVSADHASGLLLPELSSSSAAAAATSFSSQGAPPSCGGVAIACPNRDVLLQMDAVLADAAFGTDFVAVQGSESGLLLPASSSSGSSSSDGSSTLPTALLIPLDVQLWRAAIQMQTVVQEEEEEEDEGRTLE